MGIITGLRESYIQHGEENTLHVKDIITSLVYVSPSLYIKSMTTMNTQTLTMKQFHK